MLWFLSAFEFFMLDFKLKIWIGCGGFLKLYPKSSKSTILVFKPMVLGSMILRDPHTLDGRNLAAVGSYWIYWKL